jgi:hypothetical protein
MMLMTKFGKFKLRLFFTIQMSLLLAFFNITSMSSNYWFKYLEADNGEMHYAGLWQSCPNQGASCVWKNGIVDQFHSLWSILVRVMITLGAVGNILCLLFFIMAFVYRTTTKNTRFVYRFMEAGNFTLFFSFLLSMAGFCVFISSKWNWSIWLHCISLVFGFIAANVLTRHFAMFYFTNTRMCGGKLVEPVITGGNDNAIAMAPMQKDACTEVCVNKIELSKATPSIIDATGSNEALIVHPITTNEFKQ